MWSAGYISVMRMLRTSWVWQGPLSWWLDLVMTARFRDGGFPFSGTEVPLKRGQLLTTVRFLSGKWGIPKSNVARFLKNLEKRGLMASKTVPVRGTRDGTTSGTLITIHNYDEYQHLRSESGESRDTPRYTTRAIEEEGKKKEAAAPVASDGRAPAVLSTPKLSAEIDEIMNDIRDITHHEVRYSPRDLAELRAFLLVASFTIIRGHVRRIAQREADGGRCSHPLSYYNTVIREDVVETTRLPASEAVQTLTEGIGSGPAGSRRQARARSVSNGLKPKDPDLRDGYEGFKKAGERLRSDAARETMLDHADLPETSGVNDKE